MADNSNEIKVGDLVVVARPHCAQRAGHPVIGGYSVVESIIRDEWCCRGCGKLEVTVAARLPDLYPLARPKGGHLPLYLLKKIPPLSELESQTSQEKLFQPAPKVPNLKKEKVK